MNDYLSLDYTRRFGVEIEINAFDLQTDKTPPQGISYVANLVQKITNDKVLIHKYGNDHYNEFWIVKPDGSCGMEICSPVLKGWNGVIRICKVIDNFDDKIHADDRCSFHVHVDVSDLSDEQICFIIKWWIKFELIFLDAMPKKRKINRYCQSIGLMDIPNDLIDFLGNYKYFSINTFHYFKKNRKTIEFRIMDNQCCKNAWIAKNWIRLVIHFVEIAYRRKVEDFYWLDPDDLFEFLGFNGNLSLGLQQVRSWFVKRLYEKCTDVLPRGVMSLEGRKISIGQITQLNNKYGEIIEDIWNEKFRI